MTQARPLAVLFGLYETLITEHDPGWISRRVSGRTLGRHRAGFADAWARVCLRRMTGLLPDYPSALCEICASLDRAPDAGTIPYWPTWFLERWPNCKGASGIRQGAGVFPRLRSPCGLMDLLLPGEAWPCS